MCFLCTFCVGFYLYGRIDRTDKGQCEVLNSNLFLTQKCNPMGSIPCLPVDSVILCYILSLLVQLMTEAIRYRTVFISWIIS